MNDLSHLKPSATSCKKKFTAKTQKTLSARRVQS